MKPKTSTLRIVTNSHKLHFDIAPIRGEIMPKRLMNISNTMANHISNVTYERIKPFRYRFIAYFLIGWLITIRLINTIKYGSYGAHQ